MSNENRNLTAKLLTELAGSKERVALLKSRLDGFATALDMAGLAAKTISVYPDNEAQEHTISKMPSVDEILAVCVELRDEAKRYEALRVEASHLRVYVRAPAPNNA